jgi:hypothetical protein
MAEVHEIAMLDEVPGVTLNKRGKWVAKTIDGTKRFLGSFDTKEEATRK